MQSLNALLLIKHLTITTAVVLALSDACGGAATMRKGSDVYATVSDGRVRGYAVSVSPPERTVNVFKKIPYAQPPVGDLRFRRLKPVRRWSGTLDATEYGPACMSNSSMTTTQRDHIDEDCIHMNIFADDRCSSANGRACSILVLIYSGAFAFGSATEYDESQIIEKYASRNLLFVMPAYRVGVFGFVDADEAAPNNVGLDDIIYALKWIHAEIHHFGGDPGRITIMGHSSGASAVQFLMASPALPPHAFRNAVAVSGVPVLAPHVNWRQTRLLLHDMKCTHDTTPKEAYMALSDGWWKASAPPGVPRTTAAELDCLRARPALDLLRSQRGNEALIRQFAYFCESSAQLPAVDFAQLLRENIKPKSLLVFATRDEMPPMDFHVREQCREHATVYGYRSREFDDACRRRYARKQVGVVKRPVADGKLSADRPLGGITAESYHACAVQMAAANRRAGGDSYRAAFWMRNHTFHASDAFFFVGFHRRTDRELSAAERQMDDYYPRMIRSFMRTGRPHDRSWRASDADGRGFQMLDFVVADNGTVTTRPEFRSGYDDPAAVQFWLEEGERIEERARRKQRGRRHSERFHGSLLSLSSDDVGGGGATPVNRGAAADFAYALGTLLLTTLLGWLLIASLVVAPLWCALERWRKSRRRHHRWLDADNDEWRPIRNADL